MTDEATAAHATINLPSWRHIARLCDLLMVCGDSGPLAVVKADYADAYKQLPLAEADELGAAATIQNPIDKMA